MTTENRDRRDARSRDLYFAEIQPQLAIRQAFSSRDLARSSPADLNVTDKYPSRDVNLPRSISAKYCDPDVAEMVLDVKELELCREMDLTGKRLEQGGRIHAHN